MKVTIPEKEGHMTLAEAEELIRRYPIPPKKEFIEGPLTEAIHAAYGVQIDNLEYRIDEKTGREYVDINYNSHAYWDVDITGISHGFIMLKVAQAALDNVYKNWPEAPTCD